LPNIAGLTAVGTNGSGCDVPKFRYSDFGSSSVDVKRRGFIGGDGTVEDDYFIQSPLPSGVGVTAAAKEHLADEVLVLLADLRSNFRLFSSVEINPYFRSFPDEDNVIPCPSRNLSGPGNQLPLVTFRKDKSTGEFTSATNSEVLPLRADRKIMIG
jgi:hypothetical protein